MEEKNKIDISQSMKLMSNKNLEVTLDPSYAGHAVKTSFQRGQSPKLYQGFLIKSYLAQLIKLIYAHTWKYPRTLAVRFELLYPKEYSKMPTNEHITQFFKSLNYRIDKQQETKRKAGTRVHQTDVNYCWVKEQDSSEHPHYHVLLLLNKDSYQGLGNYSDPVSLMGLMRNSWAAALSLTYEQTKGIVNASEHKNNKRIKPVHYVNRGSEDYQAQLDELIYRGSYLCKLETKRFLNNRSRNFGSSLVN
ncbi:inovirus Gp2 family protein [Hydrogenovibrio thermophilus]|uniref:Inovirus Gp2 family protein n=1 Tax=Hydrogenovibrio thermophilus TaxID=265883 RepID=A0A410H1A7_9GAMM|nr:inovirus Gp2 family protein [Hydrogenovibrio thermophilus]QAB14601.1 inovirus Gp2 family protein [Hydrogenovibrio thermophilus]